MNESSQENRIPVVWRGNSQKCLRKFLNEAKSNLGYNLDLVQTGKDPLDWKPFPCSEQGVKELRTEVTEGFYRVVYYLKIQGCVVVLHAFQKSKRRTDKKDVRTIETRLTRLRKDLESGVFYEELKELQKKK